MNKINSLYSNTKMKRMFLMVKGACASMHLGQNLTWLNINKVLGANSNAVVGSSQSYRDFVRIPGKKIKSAFNSFFGLFTNTREMHGGVCPFKQRIV